MDEVDDYIFSQIADAIGKLNEKIERLVEAIDTAARGIDSVLAFDFENTIDPDDVEELEAIRAALNETLRKEGYR